MQLDHLKAHRTRRRILAGAMRRIASFGLLALSSALHAPAHGQDVAWGQLAPLQHEYREAQPWSRAHDVASYTREKSGTAFFVDDAGHLLTARHAAQDCIGLVVAKEGRAVVAHLIALSSSADLALIKVPRTLGLAAVFPSRVVASSHDMVFASAFDRLQASRGLLANATVAASPASGSRALEIDSDASFGASGAPVLDGRGLVQGVVSLGIASGRVLAVSASEAKSFLAANSVRFEQDDRSQLSAAGSRADRAASISARVICLQN